MPWQCGYCGNVPGPGVTLHFWPVKEKQQNDSWKRFVQVKRKGWVPSSASKLCSAHFEEQCFENYIQYRHGHSQRLILKQGATPTVHQTFHLVSGLGSKNACCHSSSLPSASCSFTSPASPQHAQLPETSFPLIVSMSSATVPTTTVSSRYCLTTSTTTTVTGHGLYVCTGRVTKAARKLEVGRAECQPIEGTNTCDVGIQVQSDVLNTTKQKCMKRSVKTQANFKERRPGHFSRGIQVTPKTEDKMISCKRRDPSQPVCHSTPVKRKYTESTSFEETVEEEDVNDVDYDPQLDNSVTQSSDNSMLKDIHEEEKLLVFKSCLLELLSCCPVCSKPCAVDESNRMGTFVSYIQRCSRCSYQRRWASQPMIGTTGLPAGNLALSAAISFCGASPTKVLRLLSMMHIPVIHYTTYLQHCRIYIHPTIYNFWINHQTTLFQQLSDLEGGLILAGDARSDSPGHCAKYNSYTFLETRINKVIDIQLVQSNEVGGATHCEKEGLIRGLAFLRTKDLTVDIIVTDRHPQIQKYLREKESTVTHYYDVWHVAKSVKKKVAAIVKKNDGDVIRGWEKSINNHIYWCAASSAGDGDLLLAKWDSIVDHMQDIHEHATELFPNCAHGQLVEGDRKKKWLKKGSKAAEMVEDVILSKRLRKDLRKLSPSIQTCQVEAVHSVIIQFASKKLSFSYRTMLIKLYQAAIHFNYNCDRRSARNREGNVIHTLRLKKSTNGQPSIQTKKTDANFGYASEMMDLLFNEVVRDPQMYSAVFSSVSVPPTLCSQYDRPEKEVVLRKHTSRFGISN